MNNIKTISIITPCLNSEHLIAETIQSVISNKAVVRNNVNLEYIICDGNSSDHTVQIVENMFSKIQQKNISTQIICEKDSGLYDALAKGLKKASGNFISYINAGDLYSPHAFEIVSDIFNMYPVKWLTGLRVSYNEKSHLKGSFLPYTYRNRLIQTGLYSDQILPFIQQESTFWHYSLNNLIDYDMLRKFNYAGDYYLWNKFSQKEKLYIVEAWLGGFKTHRYQLSEQIQSYHNEMNKIATNPNFFDYMIALFDKILWQSPATVKRYINRKTLFRFDPKQLNYKLSSK
ncbi:MAG: glycosyltransferase [Desulfobacterales bacterium]|nr:glycosyltransferase [Desulfobacterales bacterium]